MVRFGTAAVRHACHHGLAGHRAWDPDTVHTIHRRLQQLEAMAIIEDLAFLPFESRRRGGGQFEITVTEHVALLVERSADIPEGTTMEILVITAVLRQASRTGFSQ